MPDAMMVGCSFFTSSCLTLRRLRCSVFATVVDLKKSQFHLEGRSKGHVALEKANQMEVRQEEKQFLFSHLFRLGNLFSHALCRTPVIRIKSKM